MAASAAPKRLSKSAVDWAKFAKTVPKDDMLSFQSFKSLSERYAAKVNSLPDALPAINFNQYKARAGAKSDVISKFETEYKALAAKIPYPKADNIIKEIDAQEAADKKATEAWIKESAVRVQDYNNKLAWWQTIPPLEQMSEQEWMYYFPGSIHDYKTQQHFADLSDYQPDMAQYQMNYRLEGVWKHPDQFLEESGH